jgi:HEAT repeat protein
MRLFVTTAVACCLLSCEIAAEPPKSEARKAADVYVSGAKARLVIGLEQDAEDVRRHKAEGLAIPELVKLLKDDNEQVRAAAIMRLGLLGSAARAVAPDLIGALKDRDASVSRAALAALCQLAPLPKDTTALVIDAWLRSEPAPFGRESVDLSLLGADALPALAKVITGPDAKACRRVVQAMGDKNDGFRTGFGPEALDFVPQFVKLLDNKDERIVYWAVQALGNVGPDAVPQLAQALSHLNLDARRAAEVCFAVTYRPADAAAAIPALTAMLKDPEPSLRVDAANALTSFGPAAASAIPALIEAARLKSPSYLASSACRALGRIDPEAKQSLPVLIEVLKGGGEACESATTALRSGNTCRR